MFNLTKIICTIGPASNSPEMLKKLMLSGMDIARLNFSHGKHEDHLANIINIRKISEELDLPVAILADLQGPKIRVAKLPGGPIELVDGKEVIITTRLDPAPEELTLIPTVYKNLPKDVKPGSRILFDDGLLEASVISVRSDTEVLCRVVKGGTLKEKKGINLPGVEVSAPAVTAQDLADLDFAIKNGLDFVALSFVRHASDIEEVKAVIHKNGLDTPVIAKIERPEAVTNFDNILKACDAVMVARGDMGVEMPPEKVPHIQKTLIKKCALAGKPVIVATQMLDSMISNPRPTRAEVSDVANAILDGADAIMLSGETASGKYPVEAVSMMSEIADEIEGLVFKNKHRDIDGLLNPLHATADSLCHATIHAAYESKAKMIVTYTESGFTSLLVSKYRPSVPILAITTSETICRRINLYWGVMPVVIQAASSTDEMITKAEDAAILKGGLKHGDNIVITGGIPVGKAGTTNMMKIHKITRTPLTESLCGVKTYDCKKACISINITPERCTACGRCVLGCAMKIYGYQNGKIYINEENLEKCSGEGLCEKCCPFSAIKIKR